MEKKPKYDGPYTQRSQNDDTISGLPLRSDGTLRPQSNFVEPIVKNNVEPVNPKE